jgi:hypothetical protein
MLFIRRLHAENFAAQNLMHEMRRHSRDLDHRRHFAHSDLNGNATRSVKEYSRVGWVELFAKSITPIITISVTNYRRTRGKVMGFASKRSTHPTNDSLLKLGA